MAPRLDNRDEGLGALACMIATACRRGTTSEIVESLAATKNTEINTISENEIEAYTEPADSHTGYVYTETIKVENFIRRKVPKSYVLVGAGK